MDTRRLSRRHALRAAGAAAALIPIGVMAPLRPAPADSALGVPICRVADTPATAGPVKKLRLTWNANAICTVGVPVADQRGIFARHGLEVELINFGGSTDPLLEAISAGKADAGVGMALR